MCSVLVVETTPGMRFSLRHFWTITDHIAGLATTPAVPCYVFVCTEVMQAVDVEPCDGVVVVRGSE